MRPWKLEDLPTSGVHVLSFSNMPLPFTRFPGVASACSRPGPEDARALDDRTLRRLRPQHYGHPAVDEDGCAQGGHFIRDIPKYALPRVLPSSRFPPLQVRGFMAQQRIVRTDSCALSSRPRHASEEARLGAHVGRTMADRLAENETGKGTPRKTLSKQASRKCQPLG